jgi:hypothetical protein
LILYTDAEQNPKWIESLNENFEPLITMNLNVEKDTDESKFIANKVKKFYFGDERICKKTWQQYVDVSSLSNSKTREFFDSFFGSEMPVLINLYSFSVTSGSYMEST